MASPAYGQQHPEAGMSPGAGQPQGAGMPPDQLTRTKQQVEDVKNIMTENVQRIIDRGETLESLDTRANALTMNADEFQRTSRTLRKKMWWKNTKMIIIMVVVAAIIIAIIIAVAVGESNSSSGGGGDPHNKTISSS